MECSKKNWVSQKDLWGNTAKIKVIVTGSKTVTDMRVMEAAIAEVGLCRDTIERVIVGGCRGAERLAERWAHANDVPVKNFGARTRGPDGKLRSAGFFGMYGRLIADALPDGGLIVIGNLDSKATLRFTEMASRAKIQIHLKRP